VEIGIKYEDGWDNLEDLVFVGSVPYSTVYETAETIAANYSIPQFAELADATYEVFGEDAADRSKSMAADYGGDRSNTFMQAYEIQPEFVAGAMMIACEYFDPEDTEMDDLPATGLEVHPESHEVIRDANDQYEDIIHGRWTAQTNK